MVDEQKNKNKRNELFFNYRSHLGVDGDDDDRTFSFVEFFVKCNRLNCSSEARSHNDCNLFPTDIDEPLTAMSCVEGTVSLSVLTFTGRRVILVP